MPDSVIEAIAKQVVTRLDNITTGAGYSFDVADVKRVNRDGVNWKPGHHAIAIVEEDEDRFPEHDLPGNPPAIAYRKPFRIEGFIRLADFTTTTDASSVNAMAAEMRKALVTESLNPPWLTFEGNAYLSDLTGTTYFRSDTHTGCIIGLDVFFRIDENNPENPR